MRILDPSKIEGASALTTTLSSIPPTVRHFGYVPDPTLLCPGDIFLFQPTKPSLLQKRIQAIQQELGLPPDHAQWTHTAIHIGNFVLVEAVVRYGVRVSNLLESTGGNYQILTRRLRDFVGLTDPFGKPFSTELEVQQRIALEAALRIGERYRKLGAVKWWVTSLSPRFYQANLGRLVGVGTVCSALVSDSIFQTITLPLSPLIAHKRPVFPADVAESELFQDVDMQWAKIPSSLGVDEADATEPEGSNHTI